jgi:hypothetical protein
MILRDLQPMSRPLFPALVLSLAMSGAALATSFDFVTTIDGAHPYSYEGRMTVSKTFCRVDVTRGAHPMFNPGYTVISQRNGQVILVLDHKQRTYFVRETNGMSGPLATVHGFAPSTAVNASIRIHSEGGETGVAEARRTTRYSLHITYNLQIAVDDEKFLATVDVSGSLWTLDGTLQTALPWGMQFAVKTGFPDIDRAIARKMPYDLPVRQLITVTRRIGDGPPVTETMTTTTSNISDEPSASSIFGALPDYKLREPNFSFGAP